MGRTDAWIVGIAVLIVAGGSVACAQILGAEASLPALVVGGVAAAVLLLIRPLRGATQTPEVEERIDRIEARIVEAREERYQMRMQAESAGRFREEFVAAVRHELKTPLNAILGFSSVLLQGVDGPLWPQQREDVEQIRAAGDYLSELVDAVLSEWHPDRQTPLPPEPMDAAHLFDRVTRLLEGQKGSREVELRWDVEEGFVGPRADQRRLLQVLINLGTNALRATESGSITFEARNAPGEAQLSVTDTGRGIPEAERESIFGAFHRGGRSEDRGGGWGLGLSIAEELVEWHGGHISVRSELGIGSTFTVHLPLEEP